MVRKKSAFQQNLINAAVRDRKRQAQNRMRVSGKGVFNLARIVGGDTKASKKPKKSV